MFFKENGQYRCAVYLRLSRSDGDQQESNSIKNQRALLNDYLGKHPELHKVDEYVDDGLRIRWILPAGSLPSSIV